MLSVGEGVLLSVKKKKKIRKKKIRFSTSEVGAIQNPGRSMTKSKVTCGRRRNWLSNKSPNKAPKKQKHNLKNKVSTSESGDAFPAKQINDEDEASLR